MIEVEKIYSLLRRIDMKIKRDLIRLCGVRARELCFLDSPIVAPRDDVERIGIYAKAEDFTVPHLTHEGDMVTYSFQRRYIYEIPNAIIDPYTGMVYDQYGNYIPESSAWEPTRLLTEIPRPRIKSPSVTLKGKYVFLPATPTYYHWLMQDLPPFLGAYSQVSKAKVLVGAHDFKPLQAFIKRYLSEEVKKCKSPIRVEKLVMAAKDGGLGIPFPPIGSVNPQDIRVLKKHFKEYIVNDKKPEGGSIMIYLSRSKWKRSFKGEEVLEQALEKIGFTIFHGDLDLFEQIKLFSNACVILGASGAAMSNITWAPPKTIVVQMHIPNVFWNFYYNLGKMCDHDYHFLEVPDESWTKLDIEHIVSKVKGFIDIKGAQ